MGRFADLLEMPKTKTEPAGAKPASGRFADITAFINETERSFFENIEESWRRGDADILNSIAAYENLIEGKGGEEATQAVLSTRERLRRKEQIDPIEGNVLSNLVYSSAKIMPGIWRGTKAGGKGAAIGAGVGAGAGALVGLAAPTVGEEPLTVAGGATIGAKAMAKLGFAEGSALFWYRQGAGEMMLNMLEKGYDPKISKTISQWAAIPYALIELVQLKQLTPGLKQGAQKVVQKTMLNILGKAAKKYGTTLTKEILEEIGQEIVQAGAEDISAYLSGKGVKINRDYFKERADRLWQTGKGALESMALLPIPGAVIDTAIQSPGVAQDTITPAEPTVTAPKITKEQIRADIENIYKKGDISHLTSLEYMIYLKHFNFIADEAEKADRFIYGGEAEIVPKDITKPISPLEGAWTLKDFVPSDKKRIVENTINEVYALVQAGEPWINKTWEGKPRAGIEAPVEPTVTAPTLSPDIEPIVTDLNKILGTAEVELSKQTKIRKEELAAKFDKVHESLQTHEGEQALYSALGNLKGELTKLGIEPPMARGFTTENYLKMFNDIRVSERLDDGEKVSLLKAFQKLTKEGEIPRPFEIALFERQFGSEFAKTLAKLRPLGERRWRQFLDVITLPKATAASLDISRSLRQDALIAIGSPKVFGKSLAAQYKLFRSEKFAQQIEKDIKTDEYAQLRKRAGVTYRERGETAGYEQRQEQFATKYAQRIPGISHSERAFVVGGNYTRALFFNKWANHWQKNGFAATMADYKNLAHITNILTGEGDVKWLGKHADFANALFFSPRFFSSRIQALTTLLDPKLGWATRKILAYHLTSFVATGLGVLGLMSLVPGCDVEKDPRSADFGKIRVGNTRIDFWAGYTPIARFVWQLMTEERKTRAGKVVQQERFDTIVRFLQSKLSPAAGFALDVGRGETFFGQKIEMKADSLIWQFLHRMVPFVIQDVTDAVLYQGLKSGMIVAPLAFHGIGAQTYPISRGAEIQIKKDEIATEVLGKKWDDLGDDVQKLLRDEFPIVEDLERKARNERENTDFIAKIANEQKEVGDRIYKNLPQDVRIELKDLDLNIGGLSRRIGTQWFLNDKRYQEYQNQTFVILNGTLPSMIRSKNWDTLAVEEKRILLEYIITQAKQYARDNVKEKANIQDLEHLEKYFRSRKE